MITSKIIGKINSSVEGSDGFVMLSDKDETLTKARALQYMQDKYLTDGSPAVGSYFCHNVSVVASDSPNEFIGIVYHRYDV